LVAKVVVDFGGNAKADDAPEEPVGAALQTEAAAAVS